MLGGTHVYLVGDRPRQCLNVHDSDGELLGARSTRTRRTRQMEHACYMLQAVSDYL